MRDFNYRHMVIENLARDAKKTPVEYLQDLFKAHRKLQSAATELGITHQCILAAMKRNNVTRRRVWDFEYAGEWDSFVGHCRRLGLHEPSVAHLKSKHALSSGQALDMARDEFVLPEVQS